MSNAGRIRELRELQNMTRKEFASIIGVDSGQYSKIESGQLSPTIKHLIEISSNFNVSIDWLLTGKGEMLKPDDASPAISHHDDDFITIPVVDIYAAAGGGYLNVDYPEQTGEIRFPTGMLSSRRGNYYCGMVKGDSMYPTLSDGDHIIFRVLPLGDWERITNNKVYLVIDRFGEAYVKRVRNRLREESRIICISDNKDFNPSEFDMMGEDIGNIYQVECRISNNMSNLGDYSYQLSALQEEVGIIKAKLNEIEKLK